MAMIAQHGLHAVSMMLRRPQLHILGLRHAAALTHRSTVYKHCLPLQTLPLAIHRSASAPCHGLAAGARPNARDQALVAAARQRLRCLLRSLPQAGVAALVHYYHLPDKR